MEVVKQINKICGFECVTYCKYSKAFFAKVPFSMSPLSNKIKQLFVAAGCSNVSIHMEAGGEWLQVSAYI